MESRIQNFLKDRESISKYRKGIQFLKEARADLVLLELSAAEPVNALHPQGMQMAAAQHYERLGYQKCLADIFSLDEISDTTSPLVADYGATEKLLADGTITEDQARELRGEL